MKVKLTLEYDGGAFCGWQRQSGVCTVQEEIERSIGVYLNSLLRRVGLPSNERYVIEASGRTDSGVHARGQVAVVRWPNGIECCLDHLRNSLNGISVPALSVLSAEFVDDSFNPRRNPHIKCYRYRMILRKTRRGREENLVWYVGSDLNVSSMIDCARLIRGTHDFSGFRASDCAAPSTKRTIVTSELVRLDSEELVYVIHGKGFLKQMVRIIVGSLVEVGLGRLSVSDLQQVLINGDRSKAGITAPAQGLTLEWVRYQ